MAYVTRRALLRGAAAMIAALPTLAEGQAAPADGPDLSFVDPELRPLAAAIRQQLALMPEPSKATLPALRKMMSGMIPPPLPTPGFQKRIVPGRGEAPAVTVFVINSRPGENLPAILHTHGGGFILGSAESGIMPLQITASRLNCVIVSVDYRLAPETTYAGSIEDNYTALKWLHDNASALGVDPTRIAVMGESAGGGHAALLAMVARDRGEVPLVFQSLIYPMLDDRTGSVRTPSQPTGTLVWTPAQNRFGWQSFLGQSPGTSQVPSQAVPARQTNLRGLPPAFIGVGSIDLFVDEDREYARRLTSAGVKTQLVVVPGAFHGFDFIGAQTSIAQRFTKAKLDAIKQAFGQL